jgi:hypothetical protein
MTPDTPRAAAEAWLVEKMMDEIIQHEGPHWRLADQLARIAADFAERLALRSIEQAAQAVENTGRKAPEGSVFALQLDIAAYHVRAVPLPWAAAIEEEKR